MIGGKRRDLYWQDRMEVHHWTAPMAPPAPTPAVPGAAMPIAPGPVPVAA